MAALDALLECLIRTAGLPAKVSILQWATSLRYQVLTQVSATTRMVALHQHAWLKKRAAWLCNSVLRNAWLLSQEALWRARIADAGCLYAALTHSAETPRPIALYAG